MEKETEQVELTLSFDEDDTAFITFEEGGTGKVVDIDEEYIIVDGDRPIATPVKKWSVTTDEPYTWRVMLPRDKKDVWGVFISNIQVYNR